MKKQLLIILIFPLFLANSFGFDTNVPDIDTNRTELVGPESLDTLKSEQQEENEETPSEPAGYGQVFMFGFLILGAMLVVWKFKNKV